jgi:hypothetical protein
MTVISTIQEEATARRILEHLGLAARAPARGSRADAPPEYADVAELQGDPGRFLP